MSDVVDIASISRLGKVTGLCDGSLLSDNGIVFQHGVILASNGAVLTLSVNVAEFLQIFQVSRRRFQVDALAGQFQWSHSYPTTMTSLKIRSRDLSS